MASCVAVILLQLQPGCHAGLVGAAGPSRDSEEANLCEGWYKNTLTAIICIVGWAGVLTRMARLTEGRSAGGSCSMKESVDIVGTRRLVGVAGCMPRSSGKMAGSRMREAHVAVLLER